MTAIARLAVLGGVVLCVAACGSSSDEPGDAAPDLTGDLDAGADVFVGGHLEFGQALGDDQVSCVGVDTCAIRLAGSAGRALTVRWVPDQGSAAGVIIAFTVVDDATGIGLLDTATATTFTDGLASTRARVAQHEGCGGTSFGVRVSVVGRPEVAPLTYRVVVANSYDWYLKVAVTYAGDRQLDGVMVYLYKSDLPGAASLTCDDIDSIQLPQADLQAGPLQVSQPAKFVILPDLDYEHEQFYTIVVRGEQTDGTPLVFGCNDTDGHVCSDSGTLVTVELDDLPLRVAGRYRVTTVLNLRDVVAGLPNFFQTVLYFILNVVSKPTESLLLLTCQLDDPVLHDICQATFTDAQNPDVYALTPFGTALLQRMDEIMSEVPQWTGYDLFGAGDDALTALEQVQVPAVFHLTCEPDAAGQIPSSCGSADWTDPPGDPQEALGTVPFAAHVTGTNSASTLVVVDQPAPLRVGHLVDHVIQRQALPAIFGDGTGGRPLVSSFEALFKYLLGGSACLSTASGVPTCCQFFADALAEAPDAPPFGVLEAQCWAWLTAATGYLGTLLPTLDPADPAPARLSTPAGQPCALTDHDGDGAVDRWGSAPTDPAACAWNVTLYVGGLVTSTTAAVYGERE